MFQPCKKNISVMLYNKKIQEVKDVFHKFDLNEDGLLHPLEFQTAVEAMGFSTNSSKIRNLSGVEDERGNHYTFEKFKDIVFEMMSEQEPKDEAISMFKIFDLDGTGKITLQNLEQVSRDAGENISPDELHAMIEEFDKDGDGKINQEEFVAILLEDEI